MKFHTLILLVAALVVFPEADAVSAQSTETTGRVLGRVVDNETGQAIVGAMITANEGRIQAISDDRGGFLLEGVAPGQTALSVEMLGYATRSETVTIRAGTLHEVEIAIARQAIALAPLEITTRSGVLEARGFYQRERETNGHFIGRDAIEDRNPRGITELLDEVPGVNVMYIETGRRTLRMTGTGGGGPSGRGALDPVGAAIDARGCEPDLYLDGTLYRNSSISNPLYENKVDDYDILPVLEIEGVEVYRGAAAPLQYKSDCGVILLWTRRGRAAMPRRATPAVETVIPLPSVPEGTLLRITPRYGGDRVQGAMQAISGDSILIAGHTDPFTLEEIRKIEQSNGTATFLERSWRGARYGVIAGLLGVVIAAAAEEFGELDEGGISGEITETSARNPAFGAKVVGATTLAGALLGGTFWHYQKWVEIRIR